jgi:hypothetical protein
MFPVGYDPNENVKHKELIVYNTNIVGALYEGFYWSSTPGGVLAYHLDFYADLIRPVFRDDRAHGFAIRCIKN